MEKSGWSSRSCRSSAMIPWRRPSLRSLRTSRANISRCTKLLSEPGKADKAKALRIAKDLGLDVDQLQKDADDPDIKKALDEAKDLAHKLGLEGTPMFLIGDRTISG